MTNITNINTVKEFDDFLASSELPVMVDFWATWCGPCKQMAPILEKFSDKNDDKVNVLKVDVDDVSELAERYRISSIPTVMTFVKGEPAGRPVIGAVPLHVLETQLDSI
jgi:thioredoxin 1